MEPKKKIISNPRRYLLLKTPEISKKVPLVEQGHVIRVKMGPKDVARKVANSFYKKKGHMMKVIHLYRKGKIMSFSVSEIQSNRKNGKASFKVKLTETTSINNDKDEKKKKEKEDKKKKEKEDKKKKKKEDKKKKKMKKYMKMSSKLSGSKKKKVEKKIKKLKSKIV